jgi:hypothetical protein
MLTFFSLKNAPLVQRMLESRGVTLNLTSMQTSIKVNYAVGDRVQYDGYLHESCSRFGVINSIDTTNPLTSLFLFNDFGCTQWCTAAKLLPATKCFSCSRSREA